MFSFAMIATFAILLALIGLLFLVRHELRYCLCEPVLEHPILIFESDDWGPADAGNTQALKKISFRRTGQPGTILYDHLFDR